MTGSSGAVDFFAIEANEYLAQLDALLRTGDPAPAVEPFARIARALRGAATMARRPALADLAAALEAVAAAVRDRRLAWSYAATDVTVAAVDGFKSLVRTAKDWSAADEVRAASLAADLRALASAGAPSDGSSSGRGSPVVPIASLFHDDEGPHVVHRNPRPAITADLRFRQAAVPLASTLRRLIGEARHAADEAARAAVGEDLRAALRDLGELAVSYDIRAVVNFARAREDALASLDDRALDLVDGAAQALVESAGTVWARPTPPSPIGVIEPAAAEPRIAESPIADVRSPEAARPTPPSGRALVELLETSITGLHEIATGASLAEHPVAPTAPVAVTADGAVSIDALVYRGRAALERARQVRDALRAAPEPDPELLAELYDLLDLAAVDEPARA